MTLDQLDRRLNAYRSDLADIRLKGRVEAERFVAGKRRRITAPVADVWKAPDSSSGMDTQFILGTDVLVFERQQGFAWVQSLTDGYVGYINAALLERDETTLTHQVSVPRTFLYPGPDLRFSPAVTLSLGCRLAIVEERETRGTVYGMMNSGKAVILSHVRPIDQPKKDYVHMAEYFLHTPYLWGGVSGFGLDCSGLVQLAMAACGKSVLRDSDMQADTIGKPLKDTASLQRGDLVFWKGHVAIMLDEANVIHANGSSMDVRVEALQQVCSRISRDHGQPIRLRRPSP